MTDVYYEFFQTPEQVRRIGSRGGRATARNRRERLSPAPPQPVRGAEEYKESVAAAIALLDAQFPWLKGVERRTVRN